MPGTDVPESILFGHGAYASPNYRPRTAREALFPLPEDFARWPVTIGKVYLAIVEQIPGANIRVEPRLVGRVPDWRIAVEVIDNIDQKRFLVDHCISGLALAAMHGDLDIFARSEARSIVGQLCAKQPEARIMALSMVAARAVAHEHMLAKQARKLADEEKYQAQRLVERTRRTFVPAVEAVTRKRPGRAVLRILKGAR